MNDIPIMIKRDSSLNAGLLKMLEPGKKGRGRPKKQHSDFDEKVDEIDDISYAKFNDFHKKSAHPITQAIPTARQKQEHIQPRTGGVLKKALLEVRGKHLNDTKSQSKKVMFEEDQDDQNQVLDIQPELQVENNDEAYLNQQQPMFISPFHNANYSNEFIKTIFG